MATRSAIGFVEYDGSVTGIYCHWDGYPEGVGKTLLEHYSDLEKVGDLLDLGDLSILGEEVGSKQSFDKPVSGTCVAYGRDRGEIGTEALEFASKDEFIKHYDPSWCEHFYLFDGKDWFHTEGDGDLVLLKERLAKEKF